MDITWDIESNNLLNRDTIDYTASPYKLKPAFSMHCIVVEEHATGKLIAFYDGDTYILDGREYGEVDQDLGYTYTLKGYVPLDYEHKTLNDFPRYIQENPLSKVVAHNSINFDHLVTKLVFGMDYTICPDTWAGKEVEIVDTMVLSKTLNPDRFGGHSLDKLSEKVGLRKIDFRPYCKDDHRFIKFAADMLYYCIRDVQVNTRVYKWLLEEKGDWPWDDAINLEKSVAELITRQEHRGFKFNRELAEANIEELDRLMDERKSKIEPILPKKKATKGFMDDFTPPVKQIMKNGQPTSYMNKFAQKIGGTIVGEVTNFRLVFEGKEYKLPLPLEPLVTEQVATINDTTHIKEWLVGSFGWNPSEYKERDLSVNSKKIKLTTDKREEAINKYVEQTLNSSFCSDRCEFLEITRDKLRNKLMGYKEGRAIKVLTNPSFTKGQEKEICPDLLRISADFPYAKDIVEYLTYKHRRNSILGGGLEWDEEEEAEKGYMAYVREDGRIPTPADTCGAATSRMKHRVCANIPRVTSLYGANMRGMFGVDSDFVQIGYDFDSLEARIESHYCVPMDTQILTKQGWKDYYTLVQGDIVLGYNAATRQKEWTQVTGKVFYKNADTVKVTAGRQSFTTTPDHRWYVEQRDARAKGYNPTVLTTRELNTGTKIIVNAPFNTEQDTNMVCSNIARGKYTGNWSERVLSMSHNERVAFLEGFLIADGYYHEHKQKPVWRWAQNDGELFEAALLASYLVHDGNVTVADNDGKQKVKVVTLCRNGRITGQRMIKEDAGLQDVWCPQTELGSWVMRQGNCITITGNCWKYDPDKDYCLSLTQDKPNDVHTKMAQRISEIIGRDFARSPAKNVKYGCTYGSAPPKVAKTIGSDLATGKIVFDAFWLAAFPLANLKDNLQRYWEITGGKKFILGIDKRKVPTRSAHAILNSLFQSGGVICAKRAMVLHDHKMKAEGLTVDFFTEDWRSKMFSQQLIAYHDESQLEVHKGLVKWRVGKSKEEMIEIKAQLEAETGLQWSDVGHIGDKWYVGYCRAGELAVESVLEAGRYYGLNVDLTAGYMLGKDWASCH